MNLQHPSSKSSFFLSCTIVERMRQTLERRAEKEEKQYLSTAREERHDTLLSALNGPSLLEKNSFSRDKGSHRRGDSLFFEFHI